MRSLKTLLMSAVLTVAATAAAHAVTLMNFTLTDTTLWEVEQGRILTLTGGYTADRSGLAGADPDTPLPTLVDAVYELDGTPILDGMLGRVEFRPRDAIFNILGVALDLDQAVPGLIPYLEAGLNRATGAPALDLGNGNSLYISYTNTQTGPSTDSGNFTLILDQVSPLTDGILGGIINYGIFELELLDSLRLGNTTGTVSGEITISAVPLSGGVVFLIGALAGLAVLRRGQGAA